jgi:phage terminase Nu1 subunit (DNA packaging protein)
MPIPSDVTGAELAQLLSLTPRRVHKLAEQGVLRRLPSGLYPASESIQRYTNYREALAEAQLTAGGGSYADARTKATQEKTTILKMQRAEMEKGLVRVDDIHGTWNMITSRIDNAFRFMGNQLGQAVSRCTTPAEVEKLLTREVHQRLTALSKAEYKEAKRRIEDVQIQSNHRV